MAERHFAVDYSKLTLRQFALLGGPVRGLMAYLNRRKFPQAVISIEVEEEFPAIDLGDIGSAFEPETEKLVAVLRALGFEEHRITAFNLDTDYAQVRVEALHADQRQVVEVTLMFDDKGQPHQSIHIYSLHGRKWLNVTDSTTYYLHNDQTECETFVTRDVIDAMQRLHKAFMEDSKRPPAREWRDFDDLWNENMQWQLRQIDRYLASGYYAELTDEEAAERSAK